MVPTLRVEVDGEDELDVRRRLAGERPRSSIILKIGARGGAVGPMVVDGKEAVTLLLAFLPVMVGVGVATVGRRSGGVGFDPLIRLVVGFV